MRFYVCLCLLAVGLVVLAWPDENNLMMVQFSKLHGPSMLDMVGIGIILVGYIPLIHQVIIRSSHVRLTIGSRFAKYLVVIVIVFSALIAVGLSIESEVLLWTSVAISSIAQAVLIYPIARNIKKVQARKPTPD